MNKKNRGILILSKQKHNKIVFNNLDRIFYFIWFIAIIVTYKTFDSSQYTKLINLTIALILIFIGYTYLIRKALYEICVDLNNETITLHPYKTKTPIKFDFNEIQRIKVNGAIYIKVHGKWFIYSTTAYSKALCALCRIRTIEWGKLCNILGPRQEERERLRLECINQ
jgi:hypothetical protein